jgi:ABC-type multidrug transport system ATPase subunit/pSer/pThr/pTyr-binding forkhead associated (FHA) protein/ABC-type multidrug transport system permease subunit
MKIGFVKDNQLYRKIAFTPNVATIVVIGRDVTCDLSFPTIKNISSEHAQLIQDENNNLYIVDLGSTNGTFINNKKIEKGVQYPFSINDLVTFSGSGGLSIAFNPDSFSSIPKSTPKPTTSDSYGTTDIIDKFRNKSTLTLGRTSENDVVLDHPIVSRRHATIEQKGKDNYILTDLGTLNGTFLNGRRISGSVSVSERDVIIIGRYKLSLRGKAQDLTKEVAIRAEQISKQFKGGKIGLHTTSFEIQSKSLMAVMGPSGCGKSTLLKALNGDAPPTNGRVLINGLDLNENFDYLKTHIGYVPQDDIVHRELTVEQSLFYAAKLRLENASSEVISQKIEQVLDELNIKHIRKSLVGKISGGQRKRVSIAVEILTDPLILFLDEPTSPLDPQTIEEFLGILKELSKKGTTVIMVTHKPEDLNYMHDVIFMSEGGHMVYQGDTKAYLNYFGVDDTVKVYAKLVDSKAQFWVDKHKKNNQVNAPKPINSNSIRKLNSFNFFSQYWWLTIRYFNIKLNDVTNSLIMIGQAPIIAGLICLIFSNITQAVPFLMAVCSVWFGTNNSAREIVGEIPIFKRERMFNQGILAYMLSKITVLSSFAAIQALLFTLIVSIRFSSASPIWNNPGGTFAWMLGLSIAATMLGLLLSAIVSTSDKVMTLVPIALIPQIMLAGIVTKIENQFVELLSYATLSRWGTEGFSIIQKNISAEVPNELKPGETTLKVVPAIDQLKESFHESYLTRFGDWAYNLPIDQIAVLIITCICFIGIYISLKTKDSIRIK